MKTNFVSALCGVALGAALAGTLAFGASAATLTITSVGTGNGDLGNVTVAGYGNPWTTPILFTDSHGNTLVVFCDDLNHIVYVGGGQSLPYVTALVMYDGLGNPLPESTSNEMGQLANIGRYDYLKGNEDGAIAAQAAIWGLEYKVAVSSTDPIIESDIVNFLKVQDNGHGWASGLVPANGTDWQAQITGIPEPSTWAMMLIGFAGVGFAGYRRTRNPPFAAA
jgi:hypothetical protein